MITVPMFIIPRILVKRGQRVADDTQIKGFVLSIVQDHKEPNLMFLGTDAGLYVSFDKGKKWNHWNKGLPQVQVNDMKIHPVEDDLVLGTFGRAFYVLDDINPLRELASKGTDILNADFDVMCTAPGYLVSYRSVDGVRFAGQGEFKGENRSYDRVGLNVWKKPVEKKEGEKAETKDEKPSRAKITITDSNGKVVRTLRRRMEDGLNRLSWGLEKEGQRFPSRMEPKEDDDLPGGGNVRPGIYKAVIEFNNKKDSVMVEVKADPRTTTSNSDAEAIENIQKQHAEMVKQAKSSYDKIVDARKSIAIVEKLLENQPDSIKKQYRELHKNLNSKLDSLSNLFIEPENVKGIQRNPDQLSSVLFGALNYVRSSWNAPKGNAMLAMEKAKVMTVSVTGAVSDFINKDWKEYKEKAKNLEVRIFKE
jgi:hypothetical protein